MSNSQVAEHHKEIKIIHACPKCGNTEGLMVIPGQGMRFYYCPACYKNEHPEPEQKQN